MSKPLAKFTIRKLSGCWDSEVYWEVTDREGRVATLCDEGVKLALGVAALEIPEGKSAKVKLYTDKPDEWDASFKIWFEPLSNSNTFYLLKRGKDIELTSEFADMVVRSVYFDEQQIKFYAKVKVKKSD